MANQQNIGHVTGLNVSYPGTLGGPGAFFLPQGTDPAPGITGGVEDGFSIAAGLRLRNASGSDPIAPDDPTALNQPPIAEFVASCFREDISNGYGLGISEGQELSLDVGSDFIGIDFEEAQLPDVILLISYVKNDTPYGGAGVARVVGGANGVMSYEEIGGAEGVFMPGGRFSIGGFDIPLFEPAAADGDGGGLILSGLSSLWITDGVPTLDQAADFFEASMQAGVVVPQAWAPVKTAGNLNPAMPSAPTGHYWNVLDLDLSGGIGSTWTDRIGGVVMELTGTLAGAREEGLQPNFYNVLPTA